MVHVFYLRALFFDEEHKLALVHQRQGGLLHFLWSANEWKVDKKKMETWSEPWRSQSGSEMKHKMAAKRDNNDHKEEMHHSKQKKVNRRHWKS